MSIPCMAGSRSPASASPTVRPGLPLPRSTRSTSASIPSRSSAGAITIREATLGGVRARIVRSERGELNIADLLARAPAQGSTELTVDHLTLTGGAVSLEDRARTPIQTWRADAIVMEMSHLSTTSSDTQGAGRLTATVGAAPVSAEVSELRLAPLHLGADWP